MAIYICEDFEISPLAKSDLPNDRNLIILSTNVPRKTTLHNCAADRASSAGRVQRVPMARLSRERSSSPGQAQEDEERSCDLRHLPLSAGRTNLHKMGWWLNVLV